MKLAIFIYSLAGGGAERQTSYILDYCIKNKMKVCLILMNESIKYEIPESTEIYYLEKSDAKENGFIKAIKIPLLAYKYASLMKKLNVTHSVSMLTRPNFINLLSRKFTKHKYNVIINELAYPSLQYSYKGFQSKFNKRMIKYLYKKADLVIGNSYGNIKDLVNNFGVAESNTKVVQNPIDLSKINAVEPITDFFDTSKFNIITLGRLDIGKNHTMLIKALGKLKNSSVRLYIFGDGDMLLELESLVEDLNLKDQVFLMGFDSNPYRYLKSSDLFIFGSNHEGFPNVLLEALACGLPILTTNCKSGPSEIMQLSEEKNDLMKTKYGILVPIKNIELMVEGIKYFLKNKDYLNDCKANGLERVKYFEKNHILDKYINTVNI